MKTMDFMNKYRPWHQTPSDRRPNAPWFFGQRAISLLLAITLLVALIPAPVQAATATPVTTDSAPMNWPVDPSPYPDISKMATRLNRLDLAHTHPDITRYVTQLYRHFLRRLPDWSGLNSWVQSLEAHLDGGADALYGFAHHPVFLKRNLSNEAFVTTLYRAALNQDPDPEQARVWIERLDAGEKRDAIIEELAGSRAFVEFSQSIGIIVARQYNSRVPETILENVKYTRYTIHRDYILLKTGSNIRQRPDASSPIIGSAARYEKVPVVSRVKGTYSTTYKTDQWYEVVFEKNEKKIHGFILSALATRRTFQFDKMADAINRAKADLDSGHTAYISNYRNANGSAPTRNGKTIDAFGTRRDQAAPAYYTNSTKADFRYITDGMLVTILDETPSFYKVSTLNFDGEYFVPRKYVSFRHSVETLKKAIVVDRKNQNEAAFEFTDGQWQMITTSYATTGANGQYQLPTELGYYMAIQKKDYFIYLHDVTKELDGYAPYVIRFNGGAYIHGVPVSFKEGQVEGNRVLDFPPTQEYLSSIGTIPRSHKCVRNYTSHAKFLYEWADIGSTIVIIIE